jgi:oligopeptide transport system substrate-binding protein
MPESLLGLDKDPFAAETGYDPGQAKKNLADAGFKDGVGVPTLSFLIRDTPTDKATAAFIQDALKTTLGINVEIQVVDSQTRSARIKSGDWDMQRGGFTQDYPDPEDWVDGQFNTGGSLNLSGCSDSQLDRLFAQARVNQDNDQRMQQYTEINKLISVGLCGIIPLYHPTNDYLISPAVHGMRELSSDQDFMQAGDWDAESWWLAK